MRARCIVVAVLVMAMTGANLGCAHKSPSTKQVAVGAAVVVGLSLLLYLAVEQCNKGANYCDNSPGQ